MRLDGSQPSDNLEDRTKWSPARNALNAASVMLNPVYAARKVRGVLIDHDIIQPSPRLRLGFPKAK